MKRQFLLLFVFITSTLLAQEVDEKPRLDTNSICNFIVDTDRGKWFTVEKDISSIALLESLKQCLGIDNYFELKIVDSSSTDGKFVRYTIQQYLYGYKVENAAGYFHCELGNVERIKQDFITTAEVSNSIQIIDTNVIIILLHEFIKNILNQDTLRFSISSAEITLFKKPFALEHEKLRFVWKLKVRFSDPKYSQYLFVDAESGEVIYNYPIAKFCTSGTGTTAHHGTQTIHAQYVNSTVGYRLYDNCSHTYHTARLHTIEDNPNPEYYDSDNNWTSSGDIPGIQTHWAAHMTLDYFGSYWGRNSYNNQGAELICHNDATVAPFPNISSNAYWDGYNTIHLGTASPLSNTDNFNTLDIIGHEFTHGVMDFSANLPYTYESGAIDESFADIFGVAVERWVIGTVDWLIGEDRGTPFRSLSNPNSYNQPDTRNGTNWYNLSGCSPNPSTNDNCGVHINSGVQNFWFYLLVNGGSGTNDIGNSYNVTGIGFADAIKIAYRTLTNELGPNTNDNFDDSRQGSINAATYWFGASSQQVCAVKQAWYAVGVGTNCTTSTTCSTPTGTTETSIGQTSTSLDWSNVTSALSYTVRYRVTGTSTWSYSYPTSSAASLTNLSCNTTYEWQVRADCSGSNSSSYTSSRTFTTNSCGGTFTGDNCSQAISITSSNSCNPTTSSVANMTSSGITIPTCSGSTSATALDIWFIFQAQAATHTILVDPEGTYSGTSNNNYVDPVIAIYSSCSSSGFIQCEDDAGGGGGNCDITVNGLMTGNYYYIRVFDYGSSQPTYGGFDICVTHSGGTTTCSTPSGTTETAIGIDYADLDWSNVSGANYYEVRYRISGGAWIYEYPSSSFQSIFGLQCNTTYEWQVRTVCSNGNSNYSSTRTFTTSPCSTPCNIPSGTTETAIGTDYADLDWSNVSTSNYYEVRYRVSGGSWIYEYPSNSFLSIYGLQCNTTYEWQIRTVCSSGNSNYSTTRTFTTSPCSTPCNAPSGTTETAIGADYADLDWSNVSGANYYELRYRISSGSWSYLSPSSSLQSIYGLQCNTTYEWQVRTFCSNSNSSYSSTRTFTTSSCSTPCNAPSGTTETTIGTDYVDLYWFNVSGANYYEVRYRISGGSWNYEYPSSNLQSIFGLQCNATYEWQIRTFCSSGNSSYSSTRTFTTSQCSNPCNTPSNTTETTIGTDYADLDWSNVSGANYYEVRYRISGGSWNYEYPYSSLQNIYGLQCNTTYEWQVRTVCSSNNSSYSTSRYFTTSSCCPSGVPTLTFPQSGTTMYGNNITFTWAAVANATGYLFEITRDVFFANIDFSTQSGFNTSGNNISIGLQQFSQDGTTYYWRVKALGNSCNSAFSAISNFKSGSCSGTYPPSPILYNPPYGSTQYGDTVYFNWSNVSCAYEYQRQLSTSSVFNSNTIISDYTSPYFSIYTYWNNPLSAGLIYYWRVRSRNNYGWSSWSNTFYYVTGGPTGIITPNNYETRFILFPNPNNGTFNCIFTNDIGLNYKFRVLNIAGQVIHERTGFASGDIEETFNLENLSSGMYFIHFNYADKQLIKKFTKY